MPVIRELQFSTSLLLAAVLFSPGGRCRAGTPTPPSKRPALSGELTTVGGLRVLRVWGTSQQRGYAHGYLLAGDILRLIDAYIAQTAISGGPEKYAQVSLPMARTMTVLRPIYRRELEGMLAGIRDRLGPEGSMLRTLGRPIEYADLLAANCSPDNVRPFCSSFMVWGTLTADSGTLTGRNLDWHRIDGLLGTGILIAHLPTKKPARHGWVSVSWPGFVGCLSGMNDAGVTVAIHDVPRGLPDRMLGLTPRGYALREAIESAGGSDALTDVAAVFRKRHAPVGSNVPVSMPFESLSKRPPAAVLEYDGRTEETGGLTIREAGTEESASGGASWLACTNHYRQRGAANPCDRYATIASELRKRATEHRAMDVATAWELLDRVAQPRPATPSLLTYQMIVFEPNRLRMHVSLADRAMPDWKSARRVTLDLRELLAPPR